ncbi:MULTISPECIES: LysR family transcriptional regulator [Novosphingobium]|jgi:DNA-binding transcriptional LysR family regulator|uniref:LysR family transcriptional regulator n=1 Tax=Novosphingobium TaxID=165696 RepID=UPI001B3C6E33|nr:MULTISPECIES: LysR family transcriptional regulator [Novosphingobium]MBF7012903.1 LysR family transcriptional regulator [Novosphingobium sp. HR1a]WJM27639.1 LysR family transcriptional regulator [Novosphingobium resinovorum]GLK44108.1 LysR family transcriptional regulator [Novosphingobium resinovorum]
MIDQYLLRYFLAVAETGNFSRAARRVSVTQPTLSVGIAKLERELGARLFDRDRQRVALTPAGSRFLVRARRIAAEYEHALVELSEVTDPTLLRIGVLNTIPTRLVEGWLTAHRALGSGETLEILDGSERDIAERLERGRIDLALSVIRPHHPRFAPEVLSRERYMMVLPPDHPLADESEVQAEQLARDRMVLRRHCEALPEINRFFVERGVRPRFVLKTTSDERVLAVVRSGAGIGMMPESFAAGPERFVPVRDFKLVREIGLLHAAAACVEQGRASPLIAMVRAHYGTTDLRRSI